MEAAEFHAAKTGHANFAESTEEKKPLTKEEKEAQLQKLDFIECYFNNLTCILS